MTDKQPITKPPAIKTRKVAYPRLFDALEDVVKEAGLGVDDTIATLYIALGEAIINEARGR